MRPPIDDLKSLWVYAYSRSSLIQAQIWIDDMEGGDPTSSKFRAILNAAVVAYARPFTTSQVTKSERLIPLAGVKPPSELSETHRDLLSLRNKVMGHADALPAQGHQETPNKVVIVRDAGGFDLHTIQTADMNEAVREYVRKLCSHFIAHCDEKLNALISKYGLEFPASSGVYELMITAAPEDWTKPFQPIVATG